MSLCIWGIPHARKSYEPTRLPLMCGLLRSFSILVVVATLCLRAGAANPLPSVTLGQNFSGSSDTSNPLGTPPDCNGVIGTRYFVEFLNGFFAVYNKTNGQSVKRISDTKFWANAGVVLAGSDGVSDPRVVYDPVAQRWFASMVDFDANSSDPSLESNDFLLAVSLTSDPTGAWKGFLFQADPDTGYFADFPTLGVDANGVYLSGDMYYGMDNPIGPSLWSFPKSDLIAASPSIAHATWFGVMGYSQRGEVLQPANCFDGSVSRILSASDIGTDSNPHSGLESFAVQNADATGATLTASVVIPTPTWTVPDNPYLGVPQFWVNQPDGTDTLLANDARLSAKVYGLGGVLYAVHNTFLNSRIAIRWYRIRAADNFLLESGTIADPDLDLIFPSIAANPYGVVTIGFNAAGTGSYMGCYAMVGQTINGVTGFSSRIQLQSSALSYHDFAEEYSYSDTSRWGDYTTTSVDPADPNRFWTIQMYPIRDSSDLYSLWVSQITELITTPQLILNIKPAGANVTLSWPNVVGSQLQSATNLAAPVFWTNVTQAPVTNATAQLTVTLPASAGRQFFRVFKP